MDSKSIAVIVPVYNAESFLPFCIETLKKQEDDKIDFILVDDGSPDHSPKLCEDIALKDDRFCVIHKPNGGQSAARNAALEIIDNDYVTFVDSDDALIGRPCKYLMEVAEKTNADIVTMDAIITSDDYKEFENNGINITETFDNAEYYKRLCKREIYDSPWGKIFKAKLFDEQRFKEGILNEDFLLLINLAKKPLSVVCTDYLGYFYRQYTGSTTGSGFKQNMIDAVYNAYYAWKFVPYDECKNAADEYFLYKILMFIVNMPKSFMTEKNKDYLFAFDYLKKLQGKIDSAALPKTIKIFLKFFIHFPYAAKFVIDFYMKMKG
ncbi:MAG: glycosyltransferase family 2 protein [Clostridia bacterium]|nr:glycosyltransferase family 2 protein [Clostridia bacterium]